MKVVCSKRTRIHIVRANFGRTQSDDLVCPYGQWHMDKTDCISTTAVYKVRLHRVQLKVMSIVFFHQVVYKEKKY